MVAIMASRSLMLSVAKVAFCRKSACKTGNFLHVSDVLHFMVGMQPCLKMQKVRDLWWLFTLPPSSGRWKLWQDKFKRFDCVETIRDWCGHVDFPECCQIDDLEKPQKHSSNRNFLVGHRLSEAVSSYNCPSLCSFFHHNSDFFVSHRFGKPASSSKLIYTNVTTFCWLNLLLYSQTFKSQTLNAAMPPIFSTLSDSMETQHNHHFSEFFFTPRTQQGRLVLQTALD